MKKPANIAKQFRFFYKDTPSKKPAVAISACLLGHNVRYDAKDKTLVTHSRLSQYFQLLAQCPEVEAGMPVPRPAVQLVQLSNKQLSALGRDDPKLDVTEDLKKQPIKSLPTLLNNKICAYVFKSKSPSCAVLSAPVFDIQGQQIALSNGLHADHIIKKMPWIIIRDEKQLQTNTQCEQLFFLCTLIDELQRSIEQKQLRQFSEHYQFLLSVVDQCAQQQLNRLAKHDRSTDYKTAFKNALEIIARDWKLKVLLSL